MIYISIDIQLGAAVIRGALGSSLVARNKCIGSMAEVLRFRTTKLPAMSVRPQTA